MTRSKGRRAPKHRTRRPRGGCGRSVSGSARSRGEAPKPAHDSSSKADVRPIRQRPSAISRLFRAKRERNAGCLENGGDRQLRSLGGRIFQPRRRVHDNLVARERPRRGTGRMSDRARAVMVATEKPNYRHCRLLRVRRKRQCSRDAADQCDELASPHIGCRTPMTPPCR